MANTEKKLKVIMLDGFSAMYGDEAFPLEIFGNSKLMELFQILLCFSQDGISRTQLIDMLYDDSVNDKNHSLDSVIYRLKKTLEKAGLPSGECIHIKNGIYSWNEEVPLSVDVVEFISAMKKSEDFEKAFHIYKKELLFDRPKRLWITEMQEKLHDMYEECVRSLSMIYTEQKKYEELYNMYSKAAELYPYDGWQDGQLIALQYLGKFDDAYDLYNDTVRKYEETLGLPLTDKNLEHVKQMGNHVWNYSASIDEIKDHLNETEEKTGAFFCSYPSFMDAYQYISRITERSGQSVFFMICEYIYLNPMGQKSPKAGEILKDAIGMSLRKGDSYTKYSNSQYLILLMGTKSEDCEIVFNRIRKNFKKKNRNSNCDLEYFVSPIQPPIEKEENFSFSNKKSRWK